MNKDLIIVFSSYQSQHLLKKKLKQLKNKKKIIIIENSLDIISSIKTALSNDFQKSLIKTVSKYGDSNASKSILKILSSVSLPKTLEKEFYDY